MKWKQCGPLNSCIFGEGFYISFAPMLNETALVLDEPKRFYILHGDYRKEYETIIDKGFDECLSLFQKLESVAMATWSDSAEELAEPDWEAIMQKFWDESQP